MVFADPFPSPYLPPLTDDFTALLDSFEKHVGDKEPEPEWRNRQNTDIYHEALINFFANANLPKSLCDKAHRTFKETKANLKKPPKSTFPLLFAVCYKVLKDEHVAMTLKEICGYVEEVSAKDIFRAFNKYLVDEQGSLPPEQLVDRFCGKLNLHHKHATNIKQLLRSNNHDFVKNQRPASIASGFIASYCKANGIAIPVSNIAMVCGISQVTIYRLLRKLSVK